MKAKFPSADPNLIANPELIGHLVRLRGEPWTPGKSGGIGRCNAEFFGALLAAETHALYDGVRFHLYDELEGTYFSAIAEQVGMKLSCRILTWSKQPGLEDLRDWRELSFLKKAVEVMRGLTFQADPFRLPRPMVALRNGILLINGGEPVFREFAPTFRFRSKSPVPFDRDAKCPRFQKELIGDMMNEDDAGLLQRYSGLALFGLNPMHRLIILGGASAAGKTTFIKIFCSIIGRERVCELRPGQLEERFEVGRFLDKSVLIASDVKSSYLSQPSAPVIKSLVGGDLLSGELKSSNEVKPIDGPFPVLLSTNCELTYAGGQGDGAAWSRRLLIVDCTCPSNRRRIADFDALLLASEGPGILNWLLTGLRLALAQIEASGDLVLTEEQEQRIGRIVLRSESIGEFVRRGLEPDGESDLSTTEAFEGYGRFCTCLGWPPLGEWLFSRNVGDLIAARFSLARRHDIKRNGRLLNGWRGVRVCDTGWRPNDPF